MMTPKRILIIEDDPDLLAALTKHFQNNDFQVEWASDGISGFGQALTQQPDIILLDLLLPERRGLQLLEDLRKYEWAKSIPVIVLTNFDDNSFMTQAANLGVVDYMVKADYQLEDIVQRVNEILAQRQPAGSD